MFKKALKDHSVGSEKPVQSSILYANVPSQSKQSSQTAPSAGVKRKLEMAGARESNLGALHSAVYYDENDFDDDDELDFEAPDPFIAPAKQAPSITPTHSNGLNASSTRNDPLNTSSYINNQISSDIKYPDLPPLPGDEDVPPTSSTQYFPWSSSPQSDKLPPPPKRRTLPWLEGDQREKENLPKQLSTPTQSKAALPWNKPASAIKKERKEHRRQSKKSHESQNSKPCEPHARVATTFLSDEQRGVLEAVVNQGKSIFFTGSAGTGKSVLMRAIIKALNTKYRADKEKVAVTASTGLAACNIEGMTLHSFAGIGLGKEAVPELVKKVRRHNHYNPTSQSIQIDI